MSDELKIIKVTRSDITTEYKSTYIIIF